jgi:hypothetical protein
MSRSNKSLPSGPRSRGDPQKRAGKPPSPVDVSPPNPTRVPKGASDHLRCHDVSGRPVRHPLDTRHPVVIIRTLDARIAVFTAVIDIA